MGIQPSEAMRLTLAEYGGILHHHNARVDPTGDSEPLDIIADEVVAAEFARAELLGIGKMVH